MRKIGYENSTLEFRCLNLFMLLWYLIKEETEKRVEYEKEQNNQEWKQRYVQKLNERN
ncbi:unnamed protein product (macronuclear) [Paramecium tetraurelia]|uniref:Uncharacterized protein n=1 Tax=Paramecium tetraurelia TaxID=5888 RepID=A0DRC0_PARTE|nr:uncharacterized protein GSPATT00019304001 [Paramecium tetraurelia]CAK85587.1 unnamed protein product [Paramecium tetraurelia]|eukprot:XP_001452984.1 hypothetical protein (macronuclear) [Paramecium tetraurelia strain d4-2]